MAINWVQRPLRLAPEMFQAVEEARGEVPRERWIREAIDMRLSNRGPIPDSRTHERQPGPNVENIRSSEQAKRSVAPIPKGHQ